MEKAIEKGRVREELGADFMEHVQPFAGVYFNLTLWVVLTSVRGLRIWALLMCVGN
jgi:hypothetical protein